MFSNLFRLQSKEKIYSHAGIIYIDESNSFFVIHAEANELTGIGFTKAEPLQSFLDNSKEWGIYRLKKDSASRKQISTEALHYVERQAPFDMAFDLLTDSKVYCTELVALSINKALNNTLITPGKTLSDRLFYAIDDIYLHEEMERLAVSSK